MHNLQELERVVLSSIIFEINPEKEEQIDRLQVKDFFLNRTPKYIYYYQPVNNS